jgi:tRNA threonylcarbamoyladenosine biosynthesis protein TsaE
LNPPDSVVIARGEAATRAAGAALAARLAPGALVALEGDLGAGKTVFVRGLAEGLGLAPEEIGSPSFVLAVEHRGERAALLHVDLYRLPEGAGIDDLGIEDALDAGCVVAVEWGERLPGFLRAVAWRVTIADAPDRGPEDRAISVVPPRGPA